MWTLEKEGKKPEGGTTFEAAQPTYTHRALVALHTAGYVK